MDEPKPTQTRRTFLKSTALAGSGLTLTQLFGGCSDSSTGAYRTEEFLSGEIPKDVTARVFNGPYAGAFLDRVAFPIGGMGAGMVCLEGTGGLCPVAVRHRPEMFNEPMMFAAISVRRVANGAKVLEGPVPRWKYYGRLGTSNGSRGANYGLPRFERASFLARFPFATVKLEDEDIPLDVELVGWSPFIPGDADASSLPVGALEYRFKNPTSASIEAVFSYNASHFMSTRTEERWRGSTIEPIEGGFVLRQDGTAEHPEHEGAFTIFAVGDETVVDHCWFRGAWFDPLTVSWKHIREGVAAAREPVEGPCPGASLSVPFTLAPGAEKTIRVLLAWYVPKPNLTFPTGELCQAPFCSETEKHVPWYAGRFKDIHDVARYWRGQHEDLRRRSALFRDAFYDTNLPNEVVEAVAANLSILKSPVVLRQRDGRIWCYEGCLDDRGCGPGSCTHVWNYAQAIPHLFPELERGLRRTEFTESQDDTGFQRFRAALPIRSVGPQFAAAADGQLGGIMKMHREWRISGDKAWLATLWPAVKRSLDYCIRRWDPKRKGILEEPQHNTYDIEFWGPNGMCTSFYLGALAAAVAMGAALGDDVSRYDELLQKGRAFMETRLFDGEYFVQHVQWEGLESPSPVEASKGSWNSDYSPEAVTLLEKEGPKYQYGTGCLSDGVVGLWLARMCGLGDIIDARKVRSHLQAVHKHNFKHDLSDHSNPQRPGYALGHEGGLLLCTWPKGSLLTLPFVYSDEVWTGIEYQVASHLMLEGLREPGLEIVRACRQRYTGAIRNPFSEFECGHWYARALASYGLLQGLTGIRYDAVDKTLHIDSKIGNDFRSFLATASGFGTVGLRNGQPFVHMKQGTLDVQHVYVAGEERALPEGKSR